MTNHEITNFLKKQSNTSLLNTLYDNKTLHLKLLTTKVLWTTGSWMWETIYAFAVLIFCLLCLCHCIKVKDMTPNIVKIITHTFRLDVNCLGFPIRVASNTASYYSNTKLLTTLKVLEEQMSLLSSNFKCCHLSTANTFKNTKVLLLVEGIYHKLSLLKRPNL